MSATEQPTASERTGRFGRLAGGPGRRPALAVAVGFIALIGGTIWKLRSLDGLPDVGDPFDVAEMRRLVEIPDADNAFVAYAAAARQLVVPPETTDETGWDLFCVPVRDGEFKTLAWSSTTPKHREYLEARRAAMETWREGSGRPDAVYHQPGRITLGSVMNLIDEGALLAGMAAMEGSRLEDAGAMDEAWGWYGAILRCSRLVGRHGPLLQRNSGAKIHALAARRILRWAADPRVGAGQLRRALHDTLTADALTPPVSESVRIDYLMCLKSVENMRNFQGMIMDFGRSFPLLGGRQPGLLDQLVTLRAVSLPLQRFRLGLSNELERSRRVFRLLFANWLAQVDRPPARQAPLAMRRPEWIYADDPTAPAAARAVSPEALDQALNRLEIAFLFDADREPSDPPWAAQGELTRERRRRSVLIVRLAAEVYRREHGAAPATAGALLGPVLAELPEGIAADDAIPAGPE